MVSKDDEGLGEIRKFPTPLRTVVVDRIRTAITNGTLKRGDRIVESQLCKTLKVGRPLLREALRYIEADGLIEVIPNVGPVVRNPSLDELRQIRDLIGAVDALCARYFAVNGSKAEMDRLEGSIDAIEKALVKGDVTTLRLARQNYYDVFAQGSGSPIIGKYVLQLIALVSGGWGSSLGIPGRPAEAVYEMRRLCEAIRSRDPEAAAAASLTLNRHASMVMLQIAASAHAGEPVQSQPPGSSGI